MDEKVAKTLSQMNNSPLGVYMAGVVAGLEIKAENTPEKKGEQR